MRASTIDEPNPTQVSNQLDIFTPEPTEKGIIGHRQARYNANVSSSQGGPYTINVPVEGSNFVVDPGSIRQHLKIKLQKYNDSTSKWEGISINDGVGIINCICSSMWRRIEVSKFQTFFSKQFIKTHFFLSFRRSMLIRSALLPLTRPVIIGRVIGRRCLIIPLRPQQPCLRIAFGGKMKAALNIIKILKGCTTCLRD